MGGQRQGSAIRWCRERTLRLLACAFLALVLVAMPPESAGAMCNGGISPAQWREWSSVVFQGRVVETFGAGRNGFSATGARMEVQRVWKGDLSGYVDVSVGPHNTMASSHYFLPDVEYLVYAQGQAPTVTVQVCSPMEPIGQVRDEVLFLSYGIPLRWSGRLAILFAAGALLTLLLDGTQRVGRRVRGVLAR
jgi:hypothetical protein